MAKAIIQQQVDELREDTDFLDAFRKSLIGVPMTFVAHEVPDAFMICDGSLVLFEDWPEFKAVYDAGKFAGMVLDAADPAYVGKFVKNGDTGLYLPDLEGLYEQASSAATAGGYLAAGLPNAGGYITGVVFDRVAPEVTGIFHGSIFQNGNVQNYYNNVKNGNSGTLNAFLSFSNPIYSDAINTVQPPSVQYVRAMYLGKPNSAAA